MVLVFEKTSPGMIKYQQIRQILDSHPNPESSIFCLQVLRKVSAKFPFCIAVFPQRKAEGSPKVCLTLSDPAWVSRATFLGGFAKTSPCVGNFLKFKFPLVPQKFLRRFP